ncbi:MAG: hypothetical protein Q7V10_02510 [Methanobacteriaceae archaeon]|nr:hypothetical protein [Methanobacteriaceae archaeon]MDO9626081.1 hypothetical protein [Methanobacteriaceae archaeon]
MNFQPNNPLPSVRFDDLFSTAIALNEAFFTSPTEDFSFPHSSASLNAFFSYSSIPPEMSVHASKS